MKFIAEQMAQLLYHITAAKAISSQVLAATPDPSHWRDSFERGVETLNYVKQVVQSLHPTGYNYPVYMDTFFNFHTQTGVITEGPRAKRRRTTSGAPSTQASAPSQEIEEQETQQTEPPQGPPSSQPSDLYRPSFVPIEQNLYSYDCYNVDIKNVKYNTFTKVLQCPPDLTCYCGMAFNDQVEFGAHVNSVHKGKGYNCSNCNLHCKTNRACWKHFRAQHLYVHTHKCTIASCTSGQNGKPYGNDSQTLVWAHMEKQHSLKNPLGCPKCTKTFTSPKYQIPHIKTKHDLVPKNIKLFGCTKCSKRYMTQEALDGHMLFHNGQQEIFVCEVCGKEYSSKTALAKHMKDKHPDEEEDEDIE